MKMMLKSSVILDECVVEIHSYESPAMIDLKLELNMFLQRFMIL